MKNKEQIAKIWDVLDSLNVDVLHNKQAIIKLENEREQPKLKQLDQSVFDGLDEKWRFAVVDANGLALIFTGELEFRGWLYQNKDKSEHIEMKVVGTGYDTSNWQNSLIERDIAKELTGSDLARIVLSKQFMQACLVSDTSDELALSGDDLQLIRMYNESEGKFISMRDPWHGCHHKYAVAVDNNRKPLTQSDVGL